MKKTLTTTTALLAFLVAPVAQAVEIPAPCQSLINDISRKIIRNGVPANDFKLLAVPKDEVQQAQGQVVGTCGSGSHRVVYIRGKNINPDVSQAGETQTEFTVQSQTVATTTIEPEQSEDIIDSALTAETAQLAPNDETDEPENGSLTDTDIDDIAVLQADAFAEDAEDNEEPVKPQPQIVITSPEDDPVFQSKIADGEGAIIIHR